MEDFDTAFVPSTIKMKHIAQMIWILVGVLVFTTVITGISYLITCYLDKDPPIEVLTMTADDTVKGGKFHYHFDAYRKRFCEVEVYRYATDVKGQIVYSYMDNRPTNGTKHRYIIDDDYQLNGKETPGTATFHIFFKWVCPNNIVHLFSPLTRDYSDNFEIYASEEDKKAGKKSIYTLPPVPNKEEK